MTEVRLEWDAFKDFVAKKRGLVFFESREIVLTQYQGLTVIGYKPDKWGGKPLNGRKLFGKSIPLCSVGYSGISSHDFGGPPKVPEKLESETKQD